MRRRWIAAAALGAAIAAWPAVAPGRGSGDAAALILRLAP